VLIVAIALVLGSSVALAPEARALGTITTLTMVQGDVFVRHASDDFVAAKAGDVLTAGDTIRTGHDSLAEITYFEGSSVRMEADAELVIEALSSEADGGTVVAMWQTVGRTWHVVTKLIAGSSRYQIRTPSSTASVRGTIFAVDVRHDAEGATATVTTSEGIVVHSAPDPARPGASTAVRVSAGQESTAASGKPAQAVHAAPASTLREAPSRSTQRPANRPRPSPERTARMDRSTPLIEVRIRAATEARAAQRDRATSSGRDRSRLTGTPRPRVSDRDSDD
jgi:hypothetical protein